MSMSTSKTLYQQVTETTYQYLGAAADRFITRQIQHHVPKDPEALMGEDLLSMIDWIRMAACLLTDDPQQVDAYIQRLRQLAEETT